MSPVTSVPPSIEATDTIEADTRVLPDEPGKYELRITVDAGVAETYTGKVPADTVKVTGKVAAV